MDHIRIIRRAFDITINYRAMWLFGILLALTSGAGGGSGGGGGRGEFPAVPYRDNILQDLIPVAVTLLCLILILGVIFAILRYVSLNAVIQMADRHEASGEKISFRQGFRLGWSRTSLRLFLVDLVLGLAVFVAFILLMALALGPLLVWLTDNQPLQVIGTIVAIGLGLLVLLAFIVAMIFISLVSQFAYRVVVLEGTGVMDGLQRGIELVRRRFWDVVLMGVILFAIGVVVGIVLIPVAVLLILGTAVIGGLPALLVGWITSQFASGALPYILGGIVALPFFLVIFLLPMLFMSGLLELFFANTWTLTYREIVPGSVLPAETAPEVQPAG
ncbi:MAG: hypothetical protein GX495_08310 [Chloroflexi bacterium]|jgi:hypothetical protein|nr:hypothetical protein [Chloroflexota bacterium]